LTALKLNFTVLNLVVKVVVYVNCWLVSHFVSVAEVM
jgi:hypothetical protein